jgi:hypothetical protein
MAKEKTSEPDKGTTPASPSTPETTPAPSAAPAKSYVVAFSGISDKEGKLRLKGETVIADELPDPDFQLKIGAISEVVTAAPAEPPKEEKPPEK